MTTWRDFLLCLTQPIQEAKVRSQLGHLVPKVLFYTMMDSHDFRTFWHTVYGVDGFRNLQLKREPFALYVSKLYPEVWEKVEKELAAWYLKQSRI